MRACLRYLGSLFVLPLGLLAGCGSSELPPGGADAVAYWQKVLLEYPDLPEKVQKVLEDRGNYSPAPYDLPQSEVRIYGQDGTVAVSGRQIDVLITDLDDATLKQLLKWWKSVPDLANELGLSPVLPFRLPETTRHIVVLGSEGRIDVSGPDGQSHQSIKVVNDEVAGRTTLGVHMFGSEGQAAFDHLVNQQRQVRGPPRAHVRAGRIGLPPPEENVTVLVIGQLSSLNFGGASGDASQDISFTQYINRHQSPEDYSGMLAGTPFAATPEELAAAARYAEGSNGSGTTSSYTASSSSSSGGASTGSYSPASSFPQAPTWQPSNTTTIPGTIPWTPPTQTGLGSGFVVPPIGPPVLPPRAMPPPVTRFR